MIFLLSSTDNFVFVWGFYYSLDRLVSKVLCTPVYPVYYVVVAYENFNLGIWFVSFMDGKTPIIYVGVHLFFYFRIEALLVRDYDLILCDNLTSSYYYIYMKQLLKHSSLKIPFDFMYIHFKYFGYQTLFENM